MSLSGPTIGSPIHRRVFPTWSVDVPPGMAESFETSGDYWHASGHDRSISLTSIVLTDQRGRPVSAREVLRSCPPMKGKRVDPPRDLAGWGVIVKTPESTVASVAISGMLVVDGRVLVATVTCDDLAWAGSVWRSIRYHGPR